MSKKVTPPNKEEIKLGIKFLEERVALWKRIGDDEEIKIWGKHLLDYTKDPYSWKKKHYTPHCTVNFKEK